MTTHMTEIALIGRAIAQKEWETTVKICCHAKRATQSIFGKSSHTSKSTVESVSPNRTEQGKSVDDY